MPKTKTIKITEAGAEILDKLLEKKIGAIKWVLDNKEPKEPENLESNIKELKEIQKQLK